MFIVITDLPKDRSNWLPHEIGVEVAFPTPISHEGQKYWHTNKVGVNFKSGLLAAEYENYETRQRVWMLVTGEMVPE